MQKKTLISHKKVFHKKKWGFFIFLDILNKTISIKYRLKIVRMKFLKKSGFTLIKVLVASLLLSSVFFAILTLISNNTRQVTNLRHSKTMDEIFLSSRTCIESFWYTALVGTTGTQSLNFSTDNLGCFTGSYDPTLSFTGISLQRQNGAETGATVFWNSFRVENNTGSLKIYSTVSDGTEKKEYDFIVEQ